MKRKIVTINDRRCSTAKIITMIDGKSRRLFNIVDVIFECISIPRDKTIHDKAFINCSPLFVNDINWEEEGVLHHSNPLSFFEIYFETYLQMCWNFDIFLKIYTPNFR